MGVGHYPCKEDCVAICIFQRTANPHYFKRTYNFQFFENHGYISKGPYECNHPLPLSPLPQGNAQIEQNFAPQPIKKKGKT
jgi:hypothetical protein